MRGHGMCIGIALVITVFYTNHHLFAQEGYIAFVSDRSGNEEIYLMKADGSAVVNVSSHSSRELAPSWSTDGTKLAFMSNRDGNWELYSIELATGNLRRLTFDEDQVDRDPSWSPDGTHIAYVSQKDNFDMWSINILNLATNELTKITHDSYTNFDPAWSPDGLQIIFGSIRNVDSDLYTIDLDGTHEHRITQRSGLEKMPAWSPDGSTIAYSLDTGDRHIEMFLMDSDGTNARQITTTTVDSQIHDGPFNFSPSWSPDGSRIVFSSLRDAINNFDIYILNLTDQSVNNITNDPASDTDPVWSLVADIPTSVRSTSWAEIKNSSPAIER